ncbi:MAG: hypothetical protein V2A56_04865 [bacterium]
MPSFSQRIGKTPIELDLQVEGVDDALRVAIWNAIWRTLIDDPWAKPKPTLREEVLDDIWEHFYRRPSDETPRDPHEILARLKEWLAECEWYRAYDLLEFLHSVLPPTETGGYELAVNRGLEAERSAYRLMRGSILPVTDAVEVREVTQATEEIVERGIGPARDHMNTAIAELGKRRGADYEKVVREATAAVQSVARWTARKDVATLQEAFTALDEEGRLPTTFKQGLGALFDTEGAQGSGHPFQQAGSEVGLKEARFTVVTASAVINYLLSIAKVELIEEDQADSSQKQIPTAESDPKALPPGRSDSPKPRKSK